MPQKIIGVRERGFTLREGFTLWEVMLVLVLLAFIATLAVPSFTVTTESVKTEVKNANLLKIDRAVQLFFQDVGRYPDDFKELEVRPEGESDWRGPYLEEMPEKLNDAGLNYELDLNGKVVLK